MESKTCNFKHLKTFWCDFSEIQIPYNEYINRIIKQDEGGEIYINNYEVRNICDIFTEI